KVARMLRAHEDLLLNWFRAKGEISNGVVEGLNNKIRGVTRRSYGFRTYEAMEITLYYTLGRLPEPESTHRFCCGGGITIYTFGRCMWTYRVEGDDRSAGNAAFEGPRCDDFPLPPILLSTQL